MLDPLIFHRSWTSRIINNAETECDLRKASLANRNVVKVVNFSSNLIFKLVWAKALRKEVVAAST